MLSTYGSGAKSANPALFAPPPPSAPDADRYQSLNYESFVFARSLARNPRGFNARYARKDKGDGGGGKHRITYIITYIVPGANEGVVPEVTTRTIEALGWWDDVRVC